MHGLNPAQLEATKYLDGPLLVLAGAGSGKTRVITQKITWLIKSCGISPFNIASITFTNKAAREMKERVSKLLTSEQSDGLHVSTFHSLGLNILREEYRALGMKPRFSIFDFADSLSLCSELDKESDKTVLRGHLQQISQWKNALINPQAALEQAETLFQKKAAALYHSYSETMRAYQAVDLDDLIMLPVLVFQQNNHILDKWQNKIRYLLIDEYQDTNACQYQLIKQISGVRAQFTAVGDDDQAIYGWRGADVDNLRRLPADYQQLKVIKLEQNYRSTLRILQSANTLIANNQKLFEKKLWSELGVGESIKIFSCRDQSHEAESVINRLEAHRLQNSSKFSDYAILYRSNHQARHFEQLLQQRKLPYRLSGGHSFFDRSEIKDICAWLRILANGEDDPAFIRAVTTPKRGIGAQTLSELGAYAGKRHVSMLAACGEIGLQGTINNRSLENIIDFSKFIQRFTHLANTLTPDKVLPQLLESLNYQQYLLSHEDKQQAIIRWENVQMFSEWLSEKGAENNSSLNEVTINLALFNRLEKNEENENVVQLSTLHAAKGLEFKHVFLVGVEEGLLPHRESTSPEQIEEERRLMYVGITRAQRTLQISHCKMRKIHGELISCKPSRFISEMGENLVNSSNVVLDKNQASSRLEMMKAILNKNST